MQKTLIGTINAYLETGITIPAEGTSQRSIAETIQFILHNSQHAISKLKVLSRNWYFGGRPSKCDETMWVWFAVNNWFVFMIDNQLSVNVLYN